MLYSEKKKKLRPFLYDCTFLMISILAKVFSLWHIKEGEHYTKAIVLVCLLLVMVQGYMASLIATIFRKNKICLDC